jgi:hypothetical protein
VGWIANVVVALERPPGEVFVPGVRHEPARAVQYVNAIYGPQEYADHGTVTMDLNPGEGLLCVGAYDGAVVFSERNLFDQPRSDLLDRVVMALPGSTCCVMGMFNGNAAFFRLYRERRQVRQVFLVDGPSGTAAAESGDRLPEEAPFWADAPPALDGEVFPLPFSADDFALELMRAYAFGQRLDERGNDLDVLTLPVQLFSFQRTGKRLGMFARRWRIR